MHYNLVVGICICLDYRATPLVIHPAAINSMASKPFICVVSSFYLQTTNYTGNKRKRAQSLKFKARAQCNRYCDRKMTPAVLASPTGRLFLKIFFPPFRCILNIYKGASKKQFFISVKSGLKTQINTHRKTR